MDWWAWMILGAVIFGAELAAIDAQFYLVFIGLSAALVGLLGLFGIDLAVWVQWLVFGILSLTFMFTFRKALYEKIRGGVEGFRDSLDGDFLVVETALDAGQQGRVSFRGSDWTVVNEGSVTIESGSRVKILRSDGLTLFVSGS